MRRISALRTLCLTLPHAPTPEEVRQLARFERLREACVPLGEEEIAALRAGLRHCWRSGNAGTLAEMVERIPRELLDRDRWLQSFSVAAQALSAATEQWGTAGSR